MTAAAERATKLRTFKYFDKLDLCIAARMAEAADYNRQLSYEWVLENVAEDRVFPVIFSMPHEHAGGVKVDTHVRCIIVLNSDGDTAMLDVNMDFYVHLRELEVPLPVNG